MKPAPHKHLIAHTDGGARGNPGPAGYGVVIHDAQGNKVAALSQYLGHQTNNFAEYQALIAALEYAVEHGPKSLKVISDSELLVRQIKGIYKVKEPTLRDLHTRAAAHVNWSGSMSSTRCVVEIAKLMNWRIRRWTRVLEEVAQRPRPRKPSGNLTVSFVTGRSNFWMQTSQKERSFR